MFSRELRHSFRTKSGFSARLWIRYLCDSAPVSGRWPSGLFCIGHWGGDTAIIEGAKKRTIRAGTTIFREHEPGDFAYLIESGKVELSACEAGQKIALTTMSAGDLFGEMAIIDNSTRTSTAIAMTDTVVIPIGRELFQEKLSNSDPIAHLFLRVVVGRYRWALRRALDNQQAIGSKTMMMASMDTRYMSARESAINRLRIEQELREAMDQEKFVVFYQPVVSIRTGVIAGFEALIRWHHPERGLLAPSEFIGVAEDTGLILPIGEWVLEQACQDLPLFQAVFDKNINGQPPLFMSVNVSPRQIDRLSKMDRLKSILEMYDTDPALIKLEITEDIIVSSPELAARALAEIKSAGVGLALDDFGTGYSSMSYLHQFPLDVLKIDRSFVAAIGKEEKGLDIVAGIISLARALKMTVIAEGVEDLQTLNKIRGLDCEYFQGFFASRPWPLEAMLASLERHCRSRAAALSAA